MTMTLSGAAAESRGDAQGTARMPLIAVVGPWGSGTTVVMQVLVRLGVLVPRPCLMTNDPRTPNSLETLAFVKLLHSCVDEPTVTITRPEAIRPSLLAFRQILKTALGAQQQPVALKHALMATMFAELNAVFDTRYIFVSRPLKDIEATGHRRQWYAHLGADGARRIYPLMEAYLKNPTRPVHGLSYPALLAEPEKTVKELAGFLGLPYTPSALEVLRRPTSSSVEKSLDVPARPPRMSHPPQ